MSYFKNLSVSAAMGALLIFASSMPSHAIVVSQTLDFSFTNFGAVSGPPGEFATISGSISYTFDTEVSSAGTAVDSASFNTPASVFPATNVLFNYRQGSDVTFAPTNSFEFEFFFEELSVFATKRDWLISIGAVGTPGDENARTSGSFFYSSFSGDPSFSTFEGFPISFDDTLSFTNNAIPDPGQGTSVSEPAPFLLFAAGLFGLVQVRRRYSR